MLSVKELFADTQSRFLQDWQEIHAAPDRDSKNLMLVKKLDAIQWKRTVVPDTLTEYEDKVWELYIEEWDHQEIVNLALGKLGNKRRHDWSKDYLYIFTLAGKFQFHIPGDDYERDFKGEIFRHNHLEPQIKNGMLNDFDIQEMAVDRLSRNLWKNDGHINMEEMNRFLPQFHGPNAEKNLAKYNLCVEKLTDLVINVYNQVMKVGTLKDFPQQMSTLDNPVAGIQNTTPIGTLLKNCTVHSAF